MKKILLLFGVLATLLSCNQTKEVDMNAQLIPSEVIDQTIASISEKYPEEINRIEKGVRHTASLWREKDGDAKGFSSFCEQNFIGDEESLDLLFQKVSRNLEILNGHFNQMSLELLQPLHLRHGEITPIDEAFGGFSAGAHLDEDLFAGKIAFRITLNFPYYTLSEKEEMGKDWSRKQWAYARLGDFFTSRVPAELKQEVSRVGSSSDVYISAYNIYAGRLEDNEGNHPFPEDMVLLSHWNLRDELKANYPLGAEGLHKQKIIYQVMKRIIDQTIPEKVVNSPEYVWNPFSNEVTKDGQVLTLEREPDTRYKQIVNNFKALRAIDAYSPLDTYIKRKFEGEMEIAQPEVEALFVRFLESDVLKQVGQLISERLGRPLQPFDIWYDGFKSRSTINEDVLTAKTRSRYPDTEAFDKDLPVFLTQLGFSQEKANWIGERVSVDPARGSGHAWGAAMKGQQSHLRTRIPESGMDYKGYNIAIHEFGHNVEQTISLYDMDYYALNGVPNTAFTEALAFIFQKRDLQLLGMNTNNPRQEALQTLDVLWSTYEIMGVSLLDMRVWKWLYKNPEATPGELKQATIRLAQEIWNDYYAPVYGMEDEPVLAIYSHMVSYPLYLSAYAYGNIIEFQLEQHLKNKKFAEEVLRIYKQGRLTPNEWMKQAVGAPLDVKPMLKAAEVALKEF
jgi:hypothetical protein